MYRVLSRAVLLALTPFALVLLPACGSENGDGASPGDATSTEAASATLEQRTSDDGSLTLLLPPSEVEDIDPDLAIEATGDAWDLAPDGATFDEPVFVVFTWPRTGNGIPVAVVEAADGTRELPLQTIDLHDRSATLVVLLTHFSSLAVEELAAAGDDDEALLAGGDDDGAPASLEDLDPIDDGDGDGAAAAIDQRIGTLATAYEAGRPSALTLPSGPILATPIAITAEEQGDLGLMIQPVNDKLAAMFPYGSAAPSGPAPAGNTDGGDAGDLLANARPVPTISDDLGTAVDISQSVQYGHVDGGVLFVVDLTDVPTPPAGGRTLVFANADGDGVFIESTKRADATTPTTTTVRDRSTLAVQDSEEDAEDREINGLGDALVVLFFPLNFPGNTPVASVNDTDYPVTGLRVNVATRTADNESIFEGAAVLDLNAVVDAYIESGGN